MPQFVLHYAEGLKLDLIQSESGACAKSDHARIVVLSAFTMFSGVGGSWGGGVSKNMKAMFDRSWYSDP